MIETMVTLKISSAILEMIPTLQEIVYKHLDRRSKLKRELADQLASHLSSLSRLFKKSATLLRGRDQNQIGQTCWQLHTEVEQLETKVMSKILSKRASNKFSKLGHEVADVEAMAAELLSKPSVNLDPHIATLKSVSGMFRGLANDAKRKGTKKG